TRRRTIAVDAVQPPGFFDPTLAPAEKIGLPVVVHDGSAEGIRFRATRRDHQIAAARSISMLDRPEAPGHVPEAADRLLPVELVPLLESLVQPLNLEGGLDRPPRKGGERNAANGQDSRAHDSCRHRPPG